MNPTNSKKTVTSTDSFCQLIINAAESHADKLAMQVIGVEGTEYTYAEILDAIRSVAFRLDQEGIAFGDRVALIGENHPRWASATGLKHGKVLNIFPEGERTFDGDLNEFKKGAAILATELDLPIVPVALDGLYKVWARSSNKISLAKVKVRFGKPFYPKEIVDLSMDDEAKYQAVTAHLKQTIQTMIDEMRK